MSQRSVPLIILDVWVDGGIERSHEFSEPHLILVFQHHQCRMTTEFVPQVGIDSCDSTQWVTTNTSEHQPRVSLGVLEVGIIMWYAKKRFKHRFGSPKCPLQS